MLKGIKKGLGMGGENDKNAAAAPTKPGAASARGSNAFQVRFDVLSDSQSN